MRWILFALLTGFAASCGQQGPLYLPEDSPADTRTLSAYTAATALTTARTLAALP